MRLVPGLASIFALLYLVSNCYSCGTITVDNADPRILYEGFWQASTVPGPGKNDLQNTLAFSDQSLATAILQFPGTSVSVYGALLPVGVWYMQSVYYLDAMQSAVHEPDPVVTAEQHRVLFYSSGPLTYGVHTLVIENVGQQFWLDYITFDVPDDDLAMPCTTAAIASATVAPLGAASNFSAPGVSSAGSAISSGNSSVALLTSPTSSFLTMTPSITAHISTNVSSSTGLASLTNLPLLSFTYLPYQSASVPTSSVLSPAPGPHETSADVTAVARAQPKLSRSAIAGIAIGGTVFVLTIAGALIAAHRRRQRVNPWKLITPFVADPEHPPLSTSTLPQARRWPEKPTIATPPRSAQTDRHSAPPIVRGRVLIGRHTGRNGDGSRHSDGGGGVWADYSSSAPAPSSSGAETRTERRTSASTVAVVESVRSSGHGRAACNA